MGKVREYQLSNKAKQKEQEEELAEDEIVESEFYGIERQYRRAVMFNLRLKGGIYASFPYSYVTKVLFDPSIALEIYVVDSIVSIKGRNLHKIYAYLMQHRLSFIKENITDIDNTPENEAFVASISIKMNE